MKNFRLFLLSILLVLPGYTVASNVIVNVTDDGDPVFMAEVLLINVTSRMVVNSDFTDKSGMYRYAAPPGLYEILVSKEEYSDVRINSLEVKDIDVRKNVDIIPAAFATEDSGGAAESDGCD